jgi:hypothetical protein
MADSNVRDQLRPGPANPRDVDTPVSRSDIRAPITGFTSAAQWGLASVLIGCTLLLAACVTLVFNVLLFRGGPAGIPTALAFAGGLIGTLVVSALGLASLLFGIRGWQLAYAARSTPVLPVAGAAVSFAGLVAWLIAAIDLMMILHSFNR